MNRPRKWTLEALDPTSVPDIQIWEVWIDQGTVEFLTTGILNSRFYRIQCAKKVLEDPIKIISGWNRVGYHEGYCYIGRPGDEPREGISLPPKPGMCFFAFVFPNGKMEEWGWEKFDLDSESDHRKEFGEDWRQIWPPSGKT